MMHRARYLASTPFSHRQERATTKLAVTYPCPTPYAAKVALIVGAIRAGLDPAAFTRQVRSLDVRPHPWGEGVINTHMVKHWEPPRPDSGIKHLPDFLGSTVTFREFLYFDHGGIDLYFPDEAIESLLPVLPFVNTFGKQGGLFALLNVNAADPPDATTFMAASDMRENAEWERVSNFTGSKNASKPRNMDSWLRLAVELVSAGTKHQHYRFDMR